MRVQYATRAGWWDSRYPVADREAGALKRLAKIVHARNHREVACPTDPEQVIAYHQPDCRGCNLYLLTREQIGCDTIDSVYTRGLAVCA